jgi:hypothetical protein
MARIVSFIVQQEGVEAESALLGLSSHRTSA